MEKCLKCGQEIDIENEKDWYLLCYKYPSGRVKWKRYFCDSICTMDYITGTAFRFGLLDMGATDTSCVGDDRCHLEDSDGNVESLEQFRKDMLDASGIERPKRQGTCTMCSQKGDWEGKALCPSCSSKAREAGEDIKNHQMAKTPEELQREEIERKRARRAARSKRRSG
jgi:hypothetical protein